MNGTRGENEDSHVLDSGTTGEFPERDFESPSDAWRELPGGESTPDVNTRIVVVVVVVVIDGGIRV